MTNQTDDGLLEKVKGILQYYEDVELRAWQKKEIDRREATNKAKSFTWMEVKKKVRMK